MECHNRYIPSLIPLPQKITCLDDTLFCSIINEDLTFTAPNFDKRIENAFKSCFLTVTAYINCNKARYALTAGCNDLQNFYKKPVQKPDSYFLKIEQNSFILEAETAAGFFYGIQTVKKLKLLYNENLPVCEISDWADTQRRCEYLEFRNFYPSFDHVLLYMNKMAQNHINTLIVELEDKRPFPTMPFLHNENGFTQAQLQRLKETAENLFIELIPLQQCFGHLEYVLRFPQYNSLREVKSSPGELCPARPGSSQLGRQLVKDISALFPASRYLHLGCDEVWTLGQCPQCKSSKKTNAELFIPFINEMIDEAASLGKIPLFWHDMLTGCCVDELKTLDKRAIVVVWMYNGNDLAYRANKMINAFLQAGLTVWGGCSVRCWDQSGDQNYPVLHKRLVNIQAWAEASAKCGLTGMINTNWSAYSALAAPYGVYETSFYPGAFAAESAWNRKPDTGTFLQRYLQLFHGVEDMTFLQEGWQFEDYFSLLARPDICLKREKALAALMCAIAKYEHAAKTEPTVALQMFRVISYPSKSEEWESLYGRYEQTLRGVFSVREELENALKPFLESEKIKEYLCSRYYIWETIEREVLRLALAQSFIEFPPVLTAGRSTKK